jgi:hypothetical protein
VRSALVLLLVFAPAVRAQDATTLIAAGDSANPFLHPDQSLVYYQRALALDSTSFDALWRVGRAQVDIGKQILDDSDASRRTRDSLYSLGRTYAERAIRADSSRSDGHFVLALALGRLSLTRGGRERVKFGRIIYDEAARTLTIDPDHDGAHHILGQWHAEVKRLSGATRFVAKVLFGGGFLGRSSWDSATVHLARAVELNPRYIYHRTWTATPRRRSSWRPLQPCPTAMSWIPNIAAGRSSCWRESGARATISARSFPGSAGGGA